VNAQWLGGRRDASQAAADLASHLQKLEGVTKATASYNPLGLPNPTLVADVDFAEDASPADWSAATALVRSGASTPQLTGTITMAVLHESGSGASVTVEPLVVGPAVVEEEIADWRELRDAVGDRVSLHLGYPADWEMPSGPIVREYTVATASDVRAVAANWPDTLPALNPAIPSRWSGPGLEMDGMPSKPMMATLSAVGAILPLGSNAPTLVGWSTPGAKGVETLAVILRAFDGFKLTIISLRDGNVVHAEPSAKMARAAQAAFATGAQEVEWESADGIRSLVSGDCPSYTAGPQTIQTSFHPDKRDTAFAVRLAQLGFVQPPDVRAGTCR